MRERIIDKKILPTQMMNRNIKILIEFKNACDNLEL